ncbi:hypothetical protein D5S17_31770 [Pseudonocardiaceae bacterium YIM PH 21723]|nr:hypothetical protein D5S17_31770 [Pseudonocardiaceae bacterium YIM PH 21723]
MFRHSALFASALLLTTGLSAATAAETPPLTILSVEGVADTVTVSGTLRCPVALDVSMIAEVRLEPAGKPVPVPVKCGPQDAPWSIPVAVGPHDVAIPGRKLHVGVEAVGTGIALAGGGDFTVAWPAAQKPASDLFEQFITGATASGGKLTVKGRTICPAGQEVEMYVQAAVTGGPQGTAEKKAKCGSTGSVTWSTSPFSATNGDFQTDTPVTITVTTSTPATPTAAAVAVSQRKIAFPIGY